MTDEVEEFTAFAEGLRPVMGTYLDLMLDIKRRCDMVFDVINQVSRKAEGLHVSGLAWPYDGRAAEEFCYCNLRMECELIAVGCLIAHGDLKGTRPQKLLSTYQADAIIRALDKLHPAFYPRPVELVSEFVATTPTLGAGPFLTKQDLLRLYWKCGDMLHLGSANDLPKVMTRTANLVTVLEWHQKIIRLLNQHRIDLIDRRVELVVRMMDEQTGGPLANMSLRQTQKSTPT